jgi:hypothetical protein
MSGLWKWSDVLNTKLILKDPGLSTFLIVLVILHAICYAIEVTEPQKYKLYDPLTVSPTYALPEEPNNWRVQLTKLRVNNLEKLMYLAASIAVFVVGSELGFRAANFHTMYNELNLIFMIYIFSLIVSYWCNWICAMQPGGLNPNGDPPLNLTGAGPLGGSVTVRTKNQGLVSPTRYGFVFWTAQWLLIICNQIQTVLLSYFSFGLVGAYTSGYPLGLLARALK